MKSPKYPRFSFKFSTPNQPNHGVRLGPDSATIEDPLFLSALIPQRQVSRQEQPRQSSWLELLTEQQPNLIREID